MKYNKSYFDSGKEFNSQRGLYLLRNLFPKNILLKFSKKHHELLIRSKIKLLKGSKKVLDAGCGNGELIKIASKEFDIYGIDINKESITELKKEKYNVYYADLNKKLPFKDSIFDCVISLHVFEHLENPENFILEIKRILKDNGKVIIAVPNFSFKRFYNDYTHKRPYPKEALFRILADNGYKNIKIKNGVHLNQLIGFLFFLFPYLRYKIESFFGFFNPWELIAIADNRKD